MVVVLVGSGSARLSNGSGTRERFIDPSQFYLMHMHIHIHARKSLQFHGKSRCLTCAHLAPSMPCHSIDRDGYRRFSTGRTFVSSYLRFSRLLINLRSEHVFNALQLSQQIFGSLPGKRTPKATCRGCVKIDLCNCLCNHYKSMYTECSRIFRPNFGTFL